MATAFDRRRGEASGRIVPAVVSPIAGDRVFVLGAEGALEVEQLASGDYSQVSQAVDLTGIDLVGAGAETVGVAMQAFVDPVGLAVAPDTIALWPMDYDCSSVAGPPVAFNALGAPSPMGEGDVTQEPETYHPAGHRGLAARFPVGSTTARFRAMNTPLIWSAPLTAYTLEVWVNFLANSHASSTGIDPVLFRCMSNAAGGGLDLSLAGLVGGHDWFPTVEHRPAGGPSNSVSFGGYSFTADVGWTLLTVVYDTTIPTADQLKLYVDGVYSCDGVAPMNVDPDPALLSNAVHLGSPDLFGNLGAVRLSDTAHDAARVLADFEASTIAPVPRAAEWRQQILVDGAVYAERAIRAAERRRWSDFFAPVRHLAGVHTVAFRLALAEVP